MAKKKVFITFIGILILLPSVFPAQAFVQKDQYSASNPPGFFAGIWHGLLSPYSLIARWFIKDVTLYATPNTGWFYDAGFLIGVGCSFPVGWAAAIISTISHIVSRA